MADDNEDLKGAHDPNSERWLVAYLRENDIEGDEAAARLRYIRDDIYPLHIVFGSNPPKFNLELAYRDCAGGCHSEAWLLDDANEEQYNVAAFPKLMLMAPPGTTPEEIQEQMDLMAQAMRVPEAHVRDLIQRNMATLN